MPTVFDVKTQGVDQLINRLKGFEPEVYKILQKETKAAAMLVGESAKGLIPGDYPLSHWGPEGVSGYRSSSIRGGIRPGFRSKSIGRVRYVSAIVRSGTKDAAGPLYMLGGKQDNGRLGGLLKGKYGDKYPRALGPAWTMHVDEAREAIQEAINRAAKAVSGGN